MRRCRKILCFVLFAALFCSGCQRRRPEPAALRLVTRVDVQYRREEQTLLRQYTAPEKMSAVLNYIRLLKDGGRPETDPERLIGEVCKITLHLSDGSRRIYHQRAGRYLSRDAHPWAEIDPKQGALLLPILEALESDAVA